ncbi:MAG: hypothetical protein OXG72_19685, partial [Acidobacteria bacterium]|nr:hypothetical protein [Acidobacteriota bacterium]
GGAVTANLDGGPVRTVGRPGPGELEARWVEPPEGTLTIRAVPGSAAAPAGRAHEVVHVIQGPQFPVARRPGRPAVSTVFDTALIGGASAADENAEVRALAGSAAVDPLTAANAETVTSVEIGISADADPVDAATALRREFLPQVAPGEVVMLHEDAGGNWAAYLAATVPASIAAGARTVTIGVSHLEHGDGANVAGACRLGFSRAVRGDDGLSRHELTIYRKRVRRTANALAVPASASWDHDGTPEAADQGLEGRLANIGEWSRVFPAYDAQTEEVMCSQATGRSDDTIPGGWSTPRRCESPAGINTVYRRSATRPAALPDGPVRVPAGTADGPPSGAGDLWQNTGVRNAFTRDWTWDGWRRAEGFPGAVEIVVYKKRAIGAATPAVGAAPGFASPAWDYDGTPETTGFAGRLTGIGTWSRAFPAYDAQTEEVVCSSATGFSTDRLAGWSPIRICANDPDLNTVYRRSADEPAALADGGTARVPAGTSDAVPAGAAQLWANTGHRNALASTWKWDGWTKSEAQPGSVEIVVYRKRAKGAADPPLPDDGGTHPAGDDHWYMAAASRPPAPSDSDESPAGWTRNAVPPVGAGQSVWFVRRVAGLWVAPQAATTWDHDGAPETAGFAGRLTNARGWSRAFPAYDAQTEEVVCAVVAGNPDDTLGASWSAVRVCENPADINKVYRRGNTRPAALADGAARVPAGTADTFDAVPAGTGYVYENTGHRNALTNTWTWDGWVRLDVVDGFPAPQKNLGMSHFAQRQPSRSGYYAFRGRLGQTERIVYYAAVNAATWPLVTHVVVGLGADAALRTYLRSLRVDDWVVVTNDQTGHVGNEPNAVAYARIRALPSIADDAEHAEIAVAPARAHPVFYTDVGDNTAGNEVDGPEGFARNVCVGFSRLDTAGLEAEETDITAALSATAWATSASEPAAVAAFSTPASRALADSDLPSGVSLTPPTVGDHPLWAARLTGAVAGDDVAWTSGGWGEVFDPGDFDVRVNDADFTVA